MQPDNPPRRDRIAAGARSALLACARGELPPNVAVLKVLIEARDPQEAERAVREALGLAQKAEERGRLLQALDLLSENPQAFATVKQVLRGVEHGGTARDPEEGLARWAADFDRMAAASPEGSVALYSLGNPELLKAATTEIVDRLEAWGLLGPDRAALDLGCGIGRLTHALSPLVAHVTGLDISPGMIARARERCAALSNVTLRVSAGRDLAECETGSLDLILAADVFPYLVQAGPDLVAAHVREAARVLRPGGELVILNFSYRDDPAGDLAEIEALAVQSGLLLVRHGQRDFALWDGVTFQIAKPK
jgi:SAM-dependent methyltransferase